MDSIVALLEATNSDESIHSSMEKGINVVGCREFGQAKKVIIKVNLCKPFPSDSGATVDVMIVENIVKLIEAQNKDAEIYVVESNSNSRSAEKAFEETGYNLLEKNYKKIHLVNLSKTHQIIIKNEKFRYFKDGLELSQIFLNCDYFVSIAKLKTHEFERFSGILKNQFGCLSIKNKEPYHPYLGNVLADVNIALKPDLCIIDGIVAMEGKGPTFGEPKQMGLLIIGNDPVATDAVSAKIIGVNPFSVPHLKNAAKRGLGEINSENIKIIGKKINEVESDFNFIPYKSFFFMRLSLKFYRFTLILYKILSIPSFFGRISERLARSFYIRSGREIITLKLLGGLKQKIKTPKVIIRLMIAARLAFH